MTHLLTSDLFAGEPALVAGVTLRPFAPAEASREYVRETLGARVGMSVASVGQVHGADVAVVRTGGHVENRDALVTDRREVLLTTVAADCALVLLADVEAGVVGACHSGWRGTVAGITGATIRAMRELGARPERLLAYVAPCISAAAFEVGEEVAAHFEPHAVVRRAEWPRPHVDLRADLSHQLREAGVPAAQTEISDACTVAHPERFFSYRAEAGTPGRMIGFIGLRAAEGAKLR